MHGANMSKLESEDIEQIETLLDIKEISIELAHYQQYLKMLYDYYLDKQKT